MKYSEVEKKLKKEGCSFYKDGSNHPIWFSPITKRNFPVPQGIVSKHTANGVLKDAGLPKKF